MATVLQHQNNVSTHNYTGENEDAQLIAKLIDLSHEKRSLSPPKQDFLLDCVHYSHNKKEINLVNDKFQKIVTSGIKENVHMAVSHISAQDSKKGEARTSFPARKKTDSFTKSDQPLFESDKLVVEDFFKQLKDKERSFRQEITSLLNKEESFKDKYPAISYTKLFDNYNRRALPKLNHKFDDPVRLAPATEFKLRQATYQNRYLKAGFGNLELADIMKLSPFNDISMNDVSKFSSNIPEEAGDDSRETAENNKTPTASNSTSNDKKLNPIDVYSKSFRKQSAPQVNKNSQSTTSNHKKNLSAIYPTKPITRVNRHESVDSTASRGARLQSSPSPINHPSENVITPKEPTQAKVDVPRKIAVKNNNVAPRYMSEIKSRPTKEEKSEATTNSNNASFDSKRTTPKPITKTFRAATNTKKEFNSTGPIKNTSGLTSPSFPKQKSGPEFKSNEKAIVPIKESRESSEVSVNSFHPHSHIERNRVGISKESQDIKEDLTECREEPNEDESISQKKGNVSKRTLTKKGSKPKVSPKKETLGAGPNTMYATESYEKTLTSPLMSYGHVGETTSRKSSRYMNIQDNFDGFEPNVDVRVPQNKDEFFECTSLTKISQIPDDSTLSKNNSHVQKASKDLSLENGAVNMNTASNYIEHNTTSQENSAVRHNKLYDSDDFTFPSNNASKVITYEPSKEIIPPNKKSPEKIDSSVRSSGPNSRRSNGLKTSSERPNKKLLLNHVPQELHSSQESSKKVIGKKIESDDSDYDFYDPDFIQEVKITKKTEQFEENLMIPDKKEEIENPLRYTFNPHEYMNEKFDSLDDQ